MVFCRALYSGITKIVKRHFPKLHLYKNAWVHHFQRESWEFHGPDKFYWHGRAVNAFDARYKGWVAYLKSKGIDQ